ncbi:hypothetical protein BKA65DRAFT_516287 [Rhexocercosporidium sp. MPI-PUGE-AT-0058]|nr:hypothetical protein BKA65DRAFT_516287 [Rhexocercosporidium sp. MPI-PUGE-AT-0058]
MPPKRKALAEASANKDTAAKPRNAKAAKTSAKSDASKKPAAKAANDSSSKDSDNGVEKKATPTSKGTSKSKTRAVKYSNANTLSKKPQWINLQWPNIGDFLDDEDQDMPEDGQLIDEFCTRVSDLGIPVSEDGMSLCEKLDREYRKRDQDAHDMHIYNDWNGWAMSELLENYLKEFNKEVFKKTTSPYKKWGYVEGLAVFFNGVQMGLVYWINNEDGERTSEIAKIFGTMILTTFDVLKEHDLFRPDSEVNNIGIISLLLLQFVKCDAVDLDCDWAPEVVRLCDEAGIKLDDVVRKQVNVDKKDIKRWRGEYKKKQTKSKYAGKDDGGDGYKYFAEKKDWKPEDDLEDDCKMWYRWDWKLEYNAFQESGSHPGGNHYDIGKMSRAEKKSYTLGTKSFSRRIREESDGYDS